MKINRYEKFIENIRGDEYSYLNDDLDANKWSDDIEYTDEDSHDDMEHLFYLIRQMFQNSGIDNIEIENKNLDLFIYVPLTIKERLRNIIKILEVVNKLKKDILPEYTCEFDLWKDNKSKPLLTFNFYYINNG